MTIVDWVDQAKALSHLPTAGLVEACLEIARRDPSFDHDDWEVRSSLIGTMHGRGGITEFEAGQSLIASADPLERALGCDILGQLGWSKPTFVDESVGLLIARLTDEDQRIVSSALTALGHRRSSRAIEPALALIDHPNDNVRFGAVMAFSCHEDRRATDALIILSRDTDRDVRDWATFGLGAMCTADYPELREALRARLADDDDEVRWEAMQGLANRQDREVVPHILVALGDESVKAGVLEAAKTAADPNLLPALTKLRAALKPDDDGYWADCLAEAIAACTPP